MKKENTLKIKTFDFSLRIVKLTKLLVDNRKEFIITKQLLRSGALVREAEYAESKRDFIHKLHIALKEANETEYWIELLYKSDYINVTEFDSVSTDLKEILKLLISSIKTIKRTINNN
ncbi:four helix bundle protein [Capnocytophaga stomatis]|uniref:Four helix bundle protein n=1 Tax=Capnocytophaga stomatis TaxID=1848904 RepID=A0A250FZG7_9FLAO|nr:four helix bundle protein [Capnocytophaga stomatis]ATA89406.1 four helix bundle protein [Capnocytophaga stomatis]